MPSPGCWSPPISAPARSIPAECAPNSLRLADLLGRFHREMPREVSGPGYLFWVFHVLRDYARTLADAGHSPAEMPRWLTLADELERAQVPLPIIFGHNDLLPANILDDGDRLWLIDFEYAGFSTAMFDLAGLTSNAAHGERRRRSLPRRLFGRTADGRAAPRPCRHAVRLAAARGHVGAGLGPVPHHRGVDYAAYTADNARALRGGARRLPFGLRGRGMTTLPSHAAIVVIGGGIVGCSTAYHLARDHKADVVLLEQGQLTSGSTWHAAGLVGQLRSSASITRVLKYSVDLYSGSRQKRAWRPAGR